MYEIVIRYLARAFVPPLRVEANAKALAELAAAIGGEEWNPRLLQELSPSGTFVQRPSLSTPASDWAISVLSGSIDVQYISIVGEQALSFDQFCEASAKYLGNALAFTGAQAQRLATVQEGVLKELSPEALDEVFTKLCNLPPGMGASANPFEWDWRVAFQIDRTFGAHQEPTNTLAIVKRLEFISSDDRRLDRLMLSTDINTRPDNLKPRFTGPDAESFLSASRGWHGGLAERLLSFLEVQ